MDISGGSLIEFSVFWRIIFRNREFQIKSVFSVKMHGGSRVFFFQKFVINFGEFFQNMSKISQIYTRKT